MNCPAATFADVRIPDPASEAMEEERKKQVQRALMSLPEKQRAAVILSYYHKLTHRQIAEALHCTIGTVKRNMFRALKKLAVELPDLCGGAE